MLPYQKLYGWNLTINDIQIIPPGTNAVDGAQIACMHDEFRLIYTNIINVDQALKRIILEAYDNMHMSQLEDNLLQYSNLLALEILMHLKQTYGFINPTQLVDNYNKMTAPIKFQDPIDFFSNILRKACIMPTQACNLTWRHKLYSFSTLAPPLMPVEDGNAVHQSTKLGLTSGANLQNPNGNKALSQALQAAKVITLSMLQNNMAPTPFLLTEDV
jgi:hypothetical protein